jgi:hypothetical protein
VTNALGLDSSQYHTQSYSSSCSDSSTALVVFEMKDTTWTSNYQKASDAITALQAQINDANSILHRNSTSTVKNAVAGSYQGCSDLWTCAAVTVTATLWTLFVVFAATTAHKLF